MCARPAKLFYCHCDLCKSVPKEKRYVAHSTHKSHKRRSKYEGMKYRIWRETPSKYQKFNS